MRNIKYIKFKIMVIIILLFAALAAASLFYSAKQEEKEYSGMFLRGVYGYLHQA